MKKHSIFIKGALSGALVTLAVIAAGNGISGVISDLTAGDGVFAAQKKNEKTVDEKLERMSNIIDRYYLYSDDVIAEDIENGIYSGFLDAMNDPYTVYYDEEETKELMETTTGEYFGIGAVMSQNQDSGQVTITKVYKDSPAQQAGLREGDILYQVDDHALEEQTLEEVVSWIKGDEGTEVKLYVYRGEDYEKQELTVVRGKIEAETVVYEMKEQNTGYIYIQEFDSVTSDQFREALDDLESQGMESLVIDLRNNPGGNLDTVVDMLSLILPEGIIVSTKDKNGGTEEYTCDGTHEFQKPLALLVNQYSASASEIFAGAVKDYGIGTLVGKTTYGKGIVQQLLDLGDGTMMKVTIAEYFTPSGENIHKKGITPDVDIDYEYDEANPQADNQLEKALEVVRSEAQQE